MKDKKFKVIHWQLQFDFSKPLPKVDKQAAPVVQKPESLECEKGIAYRDQFLKMIGTPKTYHEMTRISRGEIIKWLNRSSTLQGMQPWEEEQIYRDHLGDTIMKVCRRMEVGLFGLPKKGQGIRSVFQSATVIGINEKQMVMTIELQDGPQVDITIAEFHKLWEAVDQRDVNLMGYFYTFLKMDAPRYVKSMDGARINSITMDDDDDNEDCDHRSTMIGALAGRLSEAPDFLEGNRQEFAQYVHDFIMEWVVWNMRETEQDLLDADFFRRYWGMGCKLKEIKQQTGHNVTRIARGQARAWEIVMGSIDIAQLAEQFGRQVLSGCNC